MRSVALRARARRVARDPARARIVALLAAVLGLETADMSVIGATAGQLQRSMGLTHTDVGLLVTSGLAVGALAALPVGRLVDRVHRVRLLVLCVGLWSAGLVVAGASSSFPMLLGTRVAVGAIAATAWPAVASLTGDLFSPQERSRVYGLILAGELAGTGAGFLLSGNVAAVLSWRFAFWVLVPPGLALSILLARALPEPERGGTSRPADADRPRAGAAPRPALVLDADPVAMPLVAAARYVLRIPTNVILIAASTLGYFFLAGERTFGVEYLRTRFDLSQPVVTSVLVLVGLAALAGVLAGGRLGDRAVARGHVSGRVVVGGIGYVIAAVLFAPGVAVTALAAAVPALCLAVGALRAAVPPLDAARLDVTPHRLWGRAEGVRTLARTALQTLAPLAFGFTADRLGGTAAGAGLQDAFLIMLAPLAGSGIIVLLAMRTYPRDVATAAATEARTRAAVP